MRVSVWFLLMIQSLYIFIVQILHCNLHCKIISFTKHINLIRNMNDPTKISLINQWAEVDDLLQGLNRKYTM